MTTRITLTVADHDVSTIVQLLIDRSHDLHVERMGNGPRPRKRPDGTTAAQVLTSLTTPFTRDQARRALVAKGYSPTTTGATLSEAVRTGKLSKLDDGKLYGRRK
jgi:hypothetical protein